MNTLPPPIPVRLLVVKKNELLDDEDCKEMSESCEPTKISIKQAPKQQVKQMETLAAELKQILTKTVTIFNFIQNMVLIHYFF